MAGEKEVKRATTKADLFLDLVNRTGDISLKEAANQIGVPEDIVGLWAETLEESGKLKIHYKFTRAYISSVDTSVKPKLLIPKSDVPSPNELKIPSPAELIKSKPKLKLPKLKILKPKEVKKPIPKKIPLPRIPHPSELKPKKKFFAKIKPIPAPPGVIDIIIDKLNQRLIRLDTKLDPTLKKNYRDLILILIENYKYIKKRDLSRLSKKYKFLHDLLTPELSKYIMLKDPFVKEEVLDFYTLLVLHKRVSNLKFLPKEDKKTELKKIDDLLRKLRKHTSYKNALDIIQKEVVK